MLLWVVSGGQRSDMDVVREFHRQPVGEAVSEEDTRTKPGVCAGMPGSTKEAFASPISFTLCGMLDSNGGCNGVDMGSSARGKGLGERGGGGEAWGRWGQSPDGWPVHQLASVG